MLSVQKEVMRIKEMITQDELILYQLLSTSSVMNA